MENADQRPKNPDEISLTDFVKWIREGLINIGNSFLFTLANIRGLFIRNRVFFICIILIGLIIGFVYSKLLRQEYYKATMILNCDYLNNQILADHIKKLNTLTLDTTGTHLAAQLNIDIKTVKNIKGFEYKPFVSEEDVIETEIVREQINNLGLEKKDAIEKIINKLNIENKNTFEITVFLLDPTAAKNLENAIVTYLNSNNYIKRRIEINQINLHSRKAKLLAESSKLDSIKEAIYANLESMSKNGRGSNNVILNDETSDPIAIFKHDLDINNELLMIDRQLYIRPDFEVIAGFTTFSTPENPRLAVILIWAFFISIVGGYLTLGLWKFDQILSTYSAK
jgi:hypothetical protein